MTTSLTASLISSIAQPGTVGQRLLLQCENEQAEHTAIDALCRWLRRHTEAHFGLLMLRGALISNINVAENLWLMCSWHSAHKPAILLAELRKHLAALAIADDEAEELLCKRPSDLSLHEIRITLLLRSLMITPQVLIFESDWFAGHGHADRELMRLATPLLAHCHWWVVTDDADVPQTGMDWTAYDIHFFLNELLS